MVRYGKRGTISLQPGMELSKRAHRRGRIPSIKDGANHIVLVVRGHGETCGAGFFVVGRVFNDACAHVNTPPSQRYRERGVLSAHKVNWYRG